MTVKQTILILGATGGIGSAIAKMVANEQTHLILHGTNDAKLAALKHLLTEGCGCTITTHNADLSQSVTTEALATELSTSYKSLNWIINAAGYIDDLEPENNLLFPTLAKAFNINTLAPIYITQALQSKLADDGGIIMISSTASLWGNPGFPIYAATKGALNVFTMALAKQFENTKQTAIVICPGGTNTEMREKIAGDAKTQQPPEDIATHIKNIVDKNSQFKNGDIVIIKNREASLHRV